ncbi:membrane protein [Mesobacillus campisalis]|uniref:Membrane protein n=1 Tax=Mesobacillus campisalis TaxID=1408103 RepID=A0A0M2T017_9BACI|nr:hypothetical protein [Mesobacillus campisalis]KKK38582.1 membrane protein [Mesobacillus campisalis]
MSDYVSLVFALGFVLIHLTSKYMKFLDAVPRSRFLSAAGGVAVAYVFMHLLPELNHYQQKMGEITEEGFALEHQAYLIAMTGLAVFYGLERMVKVSKKNGDSNHASPGVFWIHMFSFFVYNAIIGYLLVRGYDRTLWSLFFYFIALTVHFLTNDHSLRQSHSKLYDRWGRWLLASGVLLGWTVGAMTAVHELVVSSLFAFLAGGVILNVLKEELPEERESSFPAFALGLLGYTLLLFLSSAF